MSPRMPKFVPSFTGAAPEPVLNPPPWHQSATGRRPPSSIPGVQTFSTRQSSLSACPPPAPCSSASRRAEGSRCGAREPYASASRTPVHFAGSTGGMKRFAPAVLAAYGMPLNALMPLTSAAAYAAEGGLGFDVAALRPRRPHDPARKCDEHRSLLDEIPA